MAAVGKAAQDYSLLVWTPETPEKQVRAAFRSKSDWVVSNHASSTANYMTVFSNLQGTFMAPEKSSIDEVRRSLEEGLRREAFNRLKDLLGISGEDLARTVRIPARTIARRSVFKPDESERILRVASAFQMAIEVLGSLGTARHWFTNPKRALGEKTPLEFCDTEPGAREVINLLGRIDHGVFS